MRVVTVCTANLCRSPFAAMVLGDLLADRGVDAEVLSTGVEAEAGHRPPPSWVDVAAEFGVDLRDHVSAAPDDVLDGADLVLTMTADHLRALVVGWPALVGRATTLGQAIVTTNPHGFFVPPRAIDALVVPGDRDVPDPVGRSRHVQRAVAGQLVEMCTWLSRVWPAAS